MLLRFMSLFQFDLFKKENDILALSFTFTSSYICWANYTAYLIELYCSIAPFASDVVAYPFLHDLDSIEVLTNSTKEILILAL